jgi:predicted enzyme related to lactoylglutathione lyase
MPEKHPVNWFEIPVLDLKRARTFYQELLGIDLMVTSMGPFRMAWFPMVEGAPGAAGSLVQGEGYVPSMTGTLVYLTVDDIDEALARVNELGGRTLMPRTPIGEYGFVGRFEDTEGNCVALHANG